ncbi:MAG: hypothetical protein H7274_24140 [Rhodoferax sp.]|nr:hypothetical protein [Rhodoferax sp.]
MTTTTHNARITGPVMYAKPDGKQSRIPLGPCLVEQMGEDTVDIIWGANGQSSAALPVQVVEAATEQGHLVLLD